MKEPGNLGLKGERGLRDQPLLGAISVVRAHLTVSVLRTYTTQTALGILSAALRLVFKNN
jgi:hypothetical protein